MIKIRSIPPRTMDNLFGKQTTARSIISIRIGLNYNNLDRRGTTNIPGAGGVGNANWANHEGSWNGAVSKNIFKRLKIKPKITTIHPKSKMECVSEIAGDYNSIGNLEIILQFRGFNFLENSFTKSKNDYGKNTCVYYNPVSYKNKRVFLVLSTIDDILESEVVPIKKGTNQLFSYEVYIPKLTESYNPSSMEVVQNNGLVIVSYKKRNIPSNQS